MTKEHSRPVAIPEQTKVLLFDLGGVLYDIDFRRVEDAFDELQRQQGSIGGNTMRYSKEEQPKAITDIEIGAITPAEFRDALRTYLNIPAAGDEAINEAWCAMLLGVFPEREQLLHQLAQQYDIYLLSNINPIHYRHLASQCKGIFASMKALFLSYELGTRKPEADIYSMVAEDIGVEKEAILFFDDALHNVQAAEKAGVPSVYVQAPEALNMLLFRQT